MFNATEESVLRLVCYLVGMKICYEYYRDKLVYSKTEKSNIIEIVTSLLASRSQGDLLRSMRTLLPKYHGFERLGLLFYEQSNKSLYFLVDADNEEYPPARYLPSSMGISGEIVKDHKIKVMDTTTMGRFNPEIDAVEGVKRVENLLYGPLFQDPPENKRLIAILQLVNKSDGPVQRKDIEFFRQMRDFYGLLALRTTERQNILNMTLKMRESSQYISRIVEMKGKEAAEGNVAHLHGLLMSVGDALDGLNLTKC
eukprot:TRINITY_DN3488_c0_g3_i2.p2 TRINITY_DN3488_c0_g3~~TRINITY_DN3488_c0_g3_i2.p2  ORF type:complete len:255 (-),score=48.56 TRINITY_DN3488_c0_g3_i2:58-822(-)